MLLNHKVFTMYNESLVHNKWPIDNTKMFLLYSRTIAISEYAFLKDILLKCIVTKRGLFSD